MTYFSLSPGVEWDTDPDGGWLNFYDRVEAFLYVRGMLTLALSEDGWEIDAKGHDWVHWIKDGLQIAMRGLGVSGEAGTEDTMKPLAERVIRATGWDWECSWITPPTIGQDVPFPPYDPHDIPYD